MPELRLPLTLLPLFPGLAREVDVDGVTVADALARLDERWPGLRDRLCDPGPVLRPHIRVFVDSRPAELDTPVAAGQRVDVLTAISGG
jgi:molybdopterin converting factor small subunit